MPSTRACSKCGEEKLATLQYFYKQKINASGELLLKGKYKICCRPSKEKEQQYAKNYYEKNKEKVNAKNMRNYFKKKHKVKVLRICKKEGFRIFGQLQ